MTPDQAQELLRFTTVGSVDDGKSTLIGRLLLESQALHRDQIAAVARESEKRGLELDLSLFTDGLKAEREQRITIDVAYRYFSTPRRKFIIADCPGHIQYTRNMVTGASTAELAVILVDARQGLVTQSRRHAFLATLLGIPNLVIAVNKMDAVDFSQERFEEICGDFREFAHKLQVKGLSFIPISALLGDNVTTKSAQTPWYDGSSLLYLLETINTGSTRNLVDFRLPVQYIIQAEGGFRGLAGRVASGRIRPGEEVVALPSGRVSRVRKVCRSDTEIAEALSGDSVVLQLEDQLDISRGDLLVRKNNLPHCSAKLDATLCWLDETPLNPQQNYLLRCTTLELKASVARVDYAIDVDTMHRQAQTNLSMNDIGRVQLELQRPLYFDSYRSNRETGAFILVDPYSNATVAAGMIRGTTPQLGRLTSLAADQRQIIAPASSIPSGAREGQQGHRGGVLWFTGLSGSGKSTLTGELEKQLFEAGYNVFLLDGDALREGLCSDLGFSPEDREENIRRVAELSALLASKGQLVLCSFISPFQSGRDFARSRNSGWPFLEIFVQCSLEECQNRDPKGLYARAKAGQISDFTGLDSPYEPPNRPDLVLNTEADTIEACVDRLRREVEARFRLSDGQH